LNLTRNDLQYLKELMELAAVNLCADCTNEKEEVELCPVRYWLEKLDMREFLEGCH